MKLTTKYVQSERRQNLRLEYVGKPHYERTGHGELLLDSNFESDRRVDSRRTGHRYLKTALGALRVDAGTTLWARDTNGK